VSRAIPLRNDPDRSELVIGMLCDALAAGDTMEVAAPKAGLVSATVYEWLREGREDEAEGVQSWAHDVHVRVCAARAQAEDALLARIRSAHAYGEVLEEVQERRNPDGELVETITKRSTRQRNDWRSAAWLLERMWPDRYGRRETHTHELRGAKTFDVPGLVLPQTPEQLEEARALEAARKGAEQPVEAGAEALENAQPNTRYQTLDPSSPDSGTDASADEQASDGVDEQGGGAEQVAGEALEEGGVG